MQADFSAEGLRRVQDLITRLGLAAADTRPARHDIGEEMLRITADRFAAGVGPDGKAWKKSRRVIENGGQTLVQSGQLAERVAYQLRGGNLDLYSWDRKARVHQLGLTIKPTSGEFLTIPIPGNPMSFRRVREVKMEARPFLGFSPDDVEMVLVILGKHFDV